ncbi:Membrane fusion protein of RND family multidrug efflux pump [hydrothermal vent metagenome]|uniref:Membrane fusion protein of RND family multidrug efflux pump n=1 Tax=hydrothermal vent metagenome TaxID=652676 RepID=A0A3B1A7L7_9ZZZZ
MHKKQILLVLLILIVAVILVVLLFIFKPQVEKLAVVKKIASVQIETVKPATVKIPVISRGTVIPRTSVTLSAQVIGEIIKVSNNFENGGFFNKGDVLVEINPLEYQLAIHTAEAQVASAKQQLAQAKAKASQAIANLKALGAKRLKQASAYARHEPQLAEADANLKAAQASYAIAKLNLKHTKVIAPFNGRITKKHIDLGNYLTIGKPVADIYAVDFAEVRLPLSDRQLALLDQSWLYQSSSDINKRTAVILKVEFLGKHYDWPASIVRSEGMVDQRDRLVYLVAQVKDPYTIVSEYPNRPPLAFGLYVDAIIEGRAFDNIIKIPRDALRNEHHVWLATAENTLEIKKITLLHKGIDSIYISSGISTGDRIIITPLDIVTEGMKLKVINAKQNKTIELENKLDSITINSQLRNNAQ